MRKITVIVSMMCLLSAGNLFADEGSHRKMAEELLIIMKVDRQVDATYDHMKAMHREQMKDMGAPEESLSYQDKMMDIMAQEMSWEKLKDEYIAVYAEVFTEEELKGLIDFYQSPVGQKFVEKTPDLTTKLMAVGQKHSQQAIPRLKAITDEMASEMMKDSKETAGGEPDLNAEKK